MNVMKAIKQCMCLLLIALGWSCENDFISELYVEPVASFQLLPEAEAYEVLAPIQFQNQGEGQTFVVYPGDAGHIYGQVNSTGFATNISGSFTYYYDEIGTYTAVWVASSINGDGTVVSAVDSVRINVIASDGGLSNVVIPSMYRMSEYSTGPYYSSYGVFVSPDTIVCPIMYAAWATTSTINTIKRAFSLQFDLLAPATTTLYWHDPVEGDSKQISSGSTTRNVWFINPQTAGGADVRLQTQRLEVLTSSGYSYNYYVAPVVIPNFTSFSVTIGGTSYDAVYDASTVVAADNKITRDGAFYNRFNVNLTLPQGTNLSALIPTFDVVNNDPNLTDGSNLVVSLNGIVQTSGASVVDFSAGSVIYDIKMGLLGDPNPHLMQEAQMIVNINH